MPYLTREMGSGGLRLDPRWYPVRFNPCMHMVGCWWCYNQTVRFRSVQGLFGQTQGPTNLGELTSRKAFSGSSAHLSCLTVH